MSSLGAVGQTLPWPDDLAGGLSRTSPPLVTWRADWVGWPRRVMTWRAGWVRLALANGGQKALLSAKSAACLGEFLRPKTDRGGHTRTQPGCSGRLSAKTAKRIGGVPWTKADKMPDERTAGCNQGMSFCRCPGTPEISKTQANQTYEQPVQLFWNSGKKAAYVPVQAPPTLDR
jgi:hypothetical protein